MFALKAKMNLSNLICCVTAFILLSCAGAKPSVKALTWEEEIAAFQNAMNKQYSTKVTSPLDKESFRVFTGHKYYPKKQNLRVKANFLRTPNEKVFKMETSSERLPEYRKYGVLKFEIDGKQYTLGVYQDIATSVVKKYKDLLFLPFKDLTNGKETHGGGRYIDFKIPSTQVVTLDFNKAYNPFCAYSKKFSCPLPPRENYLNVAIPAGMKLDLEKY